MFKKYFRNSYHYPRAFFLSNIFIFFLTLLKKGEWNQYSEPCLIIDKIMPSDRRKRVEIVRKIINYTLKMWTCHPKINLHLRHNYRASHQQLNHIKSNQDYRSDQDGCLRKSSTLRAGITANLINMYMECKNSERTMRNKYQWKMLEQDVQQFYFYKRKNVTSAPLCRNRYLFTL